MHFFLHFFSLVVGDDAEPRVVVPARVARPQCCCLVDAELAVAEGVSAASVHVDAHGESALPLPVACGRGRGGVGPTVRFFMCRERDRRAWRAGGAVGVRAVAGRERVGRPCCGGGCVVAHVESGHGALRRRGGRACGRVRKGRSLPRGGLRREGPGRLRCGCSRAGGGSAVAVVARHHQADDARHGRRRGQDAQRRGEEAE